MKDNLNSIGNVPLKLLDGRKGDMKNRTECARETMANNAVNVAKTYGIVAGTALAVDTFAGNKKVVSFIAEKFPKVAAFGQKVAKSTVDYAKKLLDSPIGKKVAEKATKIASKVTKHLPEIGKKAINFLKSNKKAAIIAAGATALFGVFIKWSHSQGRTDQKYEDKAKFEENRKEHEPRFE